MGNAKYIGRVGALAVTLGVGVAMASTPAVVYAEPSSPSSSSSDSPSSSSSDSPSTSDTPSSTDTTSTGNDAESTDGIAAADPPDPEPAAPSDPPGVSTEGTDIPADDDTVDSSEEALDEDGADEPTGGEDEEESSPATGDEDAASTDAASAQDDVTGDDSSSVESTVAPASDSHESRASVAPNTSGDVESFVSAAVGQFARAAETQSQLRTTDEVDDTAKDFAATDPADARTTAATTFSTMTAPEAAAPTVTQPRPTLVSVVSDLVAAVLQPLMSLGTGSPIQVPALWAMLSAVRDEFERVITQSTAPPAAQYSVTQIAGPSLVADPNPNVLVIGVDGANLSRILADPENDNFFALMDDGTTAASSIVGHTTLSNPSWTAILTGAWGEKTGVFNNVFTPWTYDKWSTVFNQLETLNPNIDTTAIADWDVINAIAGAGSIPADENIFVPQIEGDADWSQTDDAVGDATVTAIANTGAGVPSFMFSYFVGVDENGHMYGGASPQYAEALRNVDDNLGEILTAVEAWEATHPGEGEWTILVVTDHGHQPQKGFGHGFQTPSETATFVIASGPNFEDGWVNPEYEIVDTTPTVLTLFGGTPAAGSDGVSLTTLDGSDELPADLHQALTDMIATNHSPDFITNVALSLRTIVGSVPYFIFDFTRGTPFEILGDILYVPTNLVAQIVARLTGVTGASIFPILPPPAPSWPGQDTTIVSILACDGASDSAADSVCSTGNVA